MASFGPVAQLRTQVAASAAFSAAFAYLDDVFRSDGLAGRWRQLQPGQTVRVELSGGAFALEQAYWTKARPDGFFESHRRYIDVQVVVEGEEWMDVAAGDRLTVRQTYDPERDLVVYADSAGSTLHLAAGDAAVFHPADAHMPGLCGPAGPVLVRKTVVKVPVG